MWATAGPYRRAQIEAAHRQAVKSALERTEREVAVVRRKTGGVVRYEKARRLLAVEAMHTSSRLGRDQDTSGIPDPQLHSHVAVIAAERRGRQLAAVESKQLFRAAREGGAWYRSELAANLGDLGLRIERRQGKSERYFAIDGVSRICPSTGLPAARMWTVRRTSSGNATAVSRGRVSSTASPSPPAAQRPPQTQVRSTRRGGRSEPSTTRPRRARRSCSTTGVCVASANVDLAGELLAEVTREQSMITERELRAKAYELSAGVCRPAAADRLVGDLARSGELLALEGGLWTTRRLRELERRTIEIAQQRTARTSPPSARNR